ncbi:unnamed protein product [Peniophora sp. CBMAI 1063]|nr:unnamed protein product [Peniophora sp. CBMAI 1063]
MAQSTSRFTSRRDLNGLNVDYALPSAIESLRQGSFAILSVSATVSSIIAGAEAQLLLFFKDTESYAPGTHPTIPPLLAALAYVALLCSISSTVGAAILSALLSELPLRSAEQGRAAGIRRLRPEGHGDMMFGHRYRMRSGWRLILVYWLLNSLISFFCTVASTAIYCASQEPPATRIVVPIVAVLAASPLLWFAFVCASSGRSRRGRSWS